MSALAWWVTAVSGWLLLSVLTALAVGRFLAFGDGAPDDEGQR